MTASSHHAHGDSWKVAGPLEGWRQLPPVGACSGLYFGLLRHLQGVIDLDAKVSHGGLNFYMA